MNNNIETLSISLFSEILALDQLLRSKIAKGLPKGMELSHFSLLNHLAHIGTERTPADLAKSFNLTRGAISNTLGKLEWAGYVHIRPDWDDARRKQVVISPSGRTARDYAFAQIGPILADATEASGTEDLKNILPALRRLRTNLAKKI
jgi:DNA-binding MarR family transcriptional regulator|tara:strand:+ start:1207 stop:1650 length:444 start_codon:yes stop_codon:yes gene_type:complete